MPNSPAFQFYAADYLADENVQLMSLEEEGCYIRLMAFCWREGSIPSDPKKLQALCKGASTTVLRVVQGCFNQSPDDGARLVHPRLEKERDKQRVWAEKSSKGGKISGEKRKGGSTTLQPPLELNGNSSSTSSSSLSTPLPPLEGGLIQQLEDAVKELAEANAVRARMKPPLAPFSWEEYARGRDAPKPPSRGVELARRRRHR